MDTAFQCQFIIVGQRQAAPDSLQQPPCIGSRQGRRRTATDEDGVNEAVPQPRLVRCHFQFLYEAVDIVVFFVLIGPILEKAAVEAFCLAERDMDIRCLQPGPVRALCHQALPYILGLICRQHLSLQSRMNDTLTGESPRKRICCLYSELQGPFLCRQGLIIRFQIHVIPPLCGGTHPGQTLPPD